MTTSVFKYVNRTYDCGCEFVRCDEGRRLMDARWDRSPRMPSFTYLDYLRDMLHEEEALYAHGLTHEQYQTSFDLPCGCHEHLCDKIQRLYAEFEAIRLSPEGFTGREDWLGDWQDAVDRHYGREPEGQA